MAREDGRLYSSMRFEGDGVTKVVTLTFPLEHGENLEVKFGRDIQVEGYVIDYDASPVLITFSKALPKGVNIVIRRNTVASEVPHIYQNTGNAKGGAEFNALTIDENFEHMSKVVIEVDETSGRAIDSMEELEDKFVGVLVDFDGVRKVAEGADAKAESAIKTANRADTKADGAVTTSTQALSTSKSAEALAESAVQVAGQANATSDTALGVANEANTTSNNANSTASSALTTANSAVNIATTAEGNSTEAIRIAEEAKGVAEGIDGKATEALVKSEEAKAEVSVATTTSNEAKDIAQVIEAKADSAIEIAGEADVKAQEALDKATEGGITETELISKSLGSGKWMREGAWGLTGMPPVLPSSSSIDKTTIGKILGDYVDGERLWAPFLNIRWSEEVGTQLIFSEAGQGQARILIRDYYNGEYTSTSRVYTTKNTTIDKSGFLRASGSANALTESDRTSSLGTSTTLVASQKLVNDVSTRTITAQNRADSAYNLANSKQDKLTFTGTGNVARMSEVNKKRDISNTVFDGNIQVKRDGVSEISLTNKSEDNLRLSISPSGVPYLHVKGQVAKLPESGGMIAETPKNAKMSSVISSRQAGVTYTNATDNYLYVSVGVLGVNPAVYFKVNSLLFGYGHSPQAHSTNTGAIAVVPPGGKYSLELDSGTIESIRFWTEITHETLYS